MMTSHCITFGQFELSDQSFDKVDEMSGADMIDDGEDTKQDKDDGLPSVDKDDDESDDEEEDDEEEEEEEEEE